MYGIIAVIGIYIRTCVLPNPFAPLDGVVLFGAPVNADMTNLIAESFIHLSVYNFVGRFYHRGSDPALGSISYMFFLRIGGLSSVWRILVRILCIKNCWVTKANLLSCDQLGECAFLRFWNSTAIDSITHSNAVLDNLSFSEKGLDCIIFI